MYHGAKLLSLCNPPNTTTAKLSFFSLSVRSSDNGLTVFEYSYNFRLLSLHTHTLIAICFVSMQSVPVPVTITPMPSHVGGARVVMSTLTPPTIISTSSPPVVMSTSTPPVVMSTLVPPKLSTPLKSILAPSQVISFIELRIYVCMFINIKNFQAIFLCNMECA